MSFELKFDTDNAAFESPEMEISRILNKIASKVSEGQSQGGVFDLNENRIGSWGYEIEEESKDIPGLPETF